MKIFDTFEDQLLPDYADVEVTLLTRTSYDEAKIQEKIKDSGKGNMFFAAALQLALVGWGGGEYGKAKADGEEFDIAELIENNGGYCDNDENTSLDPDDLTPKRVIRVHRWQIAKWIKDHKVESFLLRKYGTKAARKVGYVIFPMGEHAVKTPEEAEALRAVYEKVDQVNGTHFVQRLDRVFQARQIYLE